MGELKKDTSSCINVNLDSYVEGSILTLFVIPVVIGLKLDDGTTAIEVEIDISSGKEGCRKFTFSGCCPNGDRVRKTFVIGWSGNGSNVEVKSEWGNGCCVSDTA